MAEYLVPGVYIEEFDSGIKAMEGVGTSTAGFVGMAQKGPIKGRPLLVTSMAEYQRKFGTYLPEREYGDRRFLPYGVEQFFANGGSACYVMRVCNAEKAKTASGGLSDSSFLTVEASNPGAWGNSLTVKLQQNLKSKTKITQKLPTDAIADHEQNAQEVYYVVEDGRNFQPGDMIYVMSVLGEADVCYALVKAVKGNEIYLSWPLQDKGGDGFLCLVEWNLTVWDDTLHECYEDITFNATTSNYIGNAASKSQLFTVKVNQESLRAGTIENNLTKEEDISLTIRLFGGEDSYEADASLYIGKDGTPEERTGLTAFRTLSDVSIMAIPGNIDTAVQSALVTHCETMANRFAILDMPLDTKEVPDLQKFRENVDNSYAAMYHPWLQIYDALSKKSSYFPPSGAMAGIFGRTDNTRGVHKAPANEIIRNCTDLSVKYNEAEQGKLNPKGINLIRALPGLGIRVWGARTCSSDDNWKYVNVRRLFIYIEESIKVNTNWAVFESNDEILWSRVEGTIRVFLTNLWRNGALSGSSPEEAFFINIGHSTMTRDDILNGRLICVIGVAAISPTEFVSFRITHKMEKI